jgi:peptidyl-prolyl cis-trans isomerase SurA
MKSLCPPLLALSLVVATTQAAIFERIIAKVNGDIVTLSDYENRQLAAVQASGVPNEKVADFLRQNGDRILQETIDEMLVYQKGEELGIADRVTSEYLDSVVKDIKQQNNIDSDETFRAQLAREGMTLEGLRRNIKRSIVRQQVVRLQIETKITIAEEEVRKDYERRRGDYTKPAAVKLQEIVLKLDTPDARAKAEALVGRARAGEDFGALAKEASVAPTRTAGGDLGSVALGELHPDLRKAIANVEPGHITDPITLAGTVRVLKVNERSEARTVPYEEARDDIQKRLRRERTETEYTRFVAGLRKDASIENRVREAPVPIDMNVPREPGLLRDTNVTAPLPEGGPASGAASGLAAPVLGQDETVVSPQDRPTKVEPGGAPKPTATPAPTGGATPR